MSTKSKKQIRRKGFAATKPTNDFKSTASKPLSPHTQKARVGKPTMKLMEGIRTVIAERRGKNGKY